MHNPAHFEAIDYLVIGHISVDKTPHGERLGGSATYSALTARSLGLRVGIVSIWGNELPVGKLSGIPIAGDISGYSTSFENIQAENGRTQVIHQVAPTLDYYHVPEAWRTTPIVHLGPIAQEVEPSLIRYFPEAFIGTTAQGWLREWDASGHVSQAEWPEANFVLNHADATVISMEDIDHNDNRIEEMAAASQLLVITEGRNGCRVFYQDEMRSFPAPIVSEIDPTGAGDIFASMFFIHYVHTRDPWEAAIVANHLASNSVTRIGLDGIPTEEEIYSTKMKV